jgi:hypothetical protein
MPWPGSTSRSDEEPLLAVPGSDIDESVPCALFPSLLTARRTQRSGPRVRPGDQSLASPASTSEVHDHHDAATGVLASSLAGHVPGGTSLNSRAPQGVGKVRYVRPNLRRRQAEARIGSLGRPCGSLPAG